MIEVILGAIGIGSLIGISIIIKSQAKEIKDFEEHAMNDNYAEFARKTSLDSL